ncbi:MAG TPA: efflux RND transporter periplasmic adaptor subunit [Bryobacteraceae bacterium]|nr:efflux RND transporter periplasmic adaptor subunit [Bryobacteraceae bacterium]
MTRGRALLALILVAAAVLVAWIVSRKSKPPEVEFTRVARETIVSMLSTNGKVEPVEWMPARAERSGVITRVLVSRGQQVRKGQPLAELDTRVAQAELSKAQAAIQQARSEEQVLDQGGRISERQQVDADLARARLDFDAAQKQVQGLERLAAKQAATRVELDAARQQAEQLRLRIQALEERKSALVTGADKEIAQSKLQEAQAAAQIARTNLDLSVLPAPMDGVLYDFDLKAGAFVNPGDLIGRVGKLDRVRVTVYVDEPDLGRVRTGESVVITWDAMPGHQWKGEVDKLPTQVIKLDTRQVGEIGCIIQNPDRDLLPNSNVTAEIQATQAGDALVLPKEVIRREGSETGVYVLTGDRVKWRKLSLGIASYTKTQVLSGLNQGDAVALPSERTLKDGLRVEPVFQ